MNWPSELIITIASFVSLSDFLSLARSCRKWYQLLTNTSYLRRILNQHDDTLKRKDLLRGLVKFAKGNFYRSSLRSDKTSCITDMNDVYTSHSIAYKKYCYIDIFGRLLLMDFIGPREEDMSFLHRSCVVRAIDTIPDKGYHLVTLNYKGKITQLSGDYKRFNVGAVEFVHCDARGIIYIDINRCCYHLDRKGEKRYLFRVPPWKQFRLLGNTPYREEKSVCALLYYLTQAGELYYATRVNVLEMNYHPHTLIASGVKKVVYYVDYSIFYYLTINGDLMYHSKSKQECILSQVSDAVCTGYYGCFYILQQGSVYRSRDIQQCHTLYKVVDVDPLFSHIHVERMDQREDLIHVW